MSNASFTNRPWTLWYQCISTKNITGDMNESRPFIIYMNIHASCLKIVNGKKNYTVLTCE